MRQRVPPEARVEILARLHQGDDAKIKLELRINELDKPGYLLTFQELMEDGEIDGGSYDGHRASDCACFYGHRMGLNYQAADYKANQILVQVYPPDELYLYSPIEELILYVQPGQTPNSSYELALLDDLINEVLAEMAEEKRT